MASADLDAEKTSSSNPREPILLSFSGIDGAGKSTQIERLRARLRDAGLIVSQFAFWDDVVVFPGLRAGISHKLLQGENGVGAPEKPVNRNDKNVCTWYLSLARCVLHFLDALHLRRRVARVCAKTRPPDVIIFDRYICDQLATLPLERAWAQYYARLILKVAPAAHITYLLDVEPEAARARKPEYPLDFLRQYRASYLRLQEIAGLALIKPMSQDEVHDAIMKKLQTSTRLRITETGVQPMAAT